MWRPPKSTTPTGTAEDLVRHWDELFPSQVHGDNGLSYAALRWLGEWVAGAAPARVAPPFTTLTIVPLAQEGCSLPPAIPQHNVVV